MVCPSMYRMYEKCNNLTELGDGIRFCSGKIRKLFHRLPVSHSLTVKSMNLHSRYRRFLFSIWNVYFWFVLIDWLDLRVFFNWNYYCKFEIYFALLLLAYIWHYFVLKLDAILFTSNFYYRQIHHFLSWHKLLNCCYEHLNAVYSPYVLYFLLAIISKIK